MKLLKETTGNWAKNKVFSSGTVSLHLEVHSFYPMAL
jgi:hypothetical protein